MASARASARPVPDDRLLVLGGDATVEIGVRTGKRQGPTAPAHRLADLTATGGYRGADPGDRVQTLPDRTADTRQACLRHRSVAEADGQLAEGVPGTGLPTAVNRAGTERGDDIPCIERRASIGIRRGPKADVVATANRTRDGTARRSRQATPVLSGAISDREFADP